MKFDVPIEKYFTYHPPKTEERRRLHEKVNKLCLDTVIIIYSPESKPPTLEMVRELITSLKDNLLEMVRDVFSRELMQNVFIEFDNFISTYCEDIYEEFEPDYYEFRIIQTLRMFANQGITIDELKNE